MILSKKKSGRFTYLYALKGLPPALWKAKSGISKIKKRRKLSNAAKKNDIVAGMREDEIKYLEAVYKDNYNLLYNYGMKIIMDKDAVKDLIQQIFLKMCRSSNFHRITNPRLYLLKAMRNACFDHFSRKHDVVHIDEVDFNVPYDDALFNSMFSMDDAGRKRLKAAINAIKSLPPRQKQILYLFYIRDFSHNEIARVLGITPQSSMNSLSRTLSKLRKLLSSEELKIILAYCLLFI